MKKIKIDKQKLMVLLVAFAFSWLFIGSLIIFHQEHIYKKIVPAHAILFIHPKTKENARADIHKTGNFKLSFKAYDLSGVDHHSFSFFANICQRVIKQTEDGPANYLLFLERLRPLRSPPQA